MSLPWVRLDTAIADHPKMLALMDAKKHRAALAYILGITYSGRHELDGFIPVAALPFIHATKSDAAALCEVDMWFTCPGGWRINGWDEYQVSSEDSRKRRQRAQEAANKRWGNEA